MYAVIVFLSQPTDDKMFLKGAWSSRGPFLILGFPKISLEQLKLETSDFVHWLAK